MRRAGLPPGSTLVVLWSGHAELHEDLRSVSLFARDDAADTASATTVEQVAAAAARSGASQLLLLVDACRSGNTVIDAATVCDRVASSMPDQRGRWIGVIASCQDYERAVDGAFVAKFLELLEHGPRDPILRMRWSSYQAGLRGDDLIDALIKEWDEDRQLPKQISLGDPGLVLANPLYRPGAPDRVVEHLLWAARGAVRGEEGNWFTGRETQLRAIVSWLRAEEPGLCVVTGPSGSGKSALVGRLISLSDPTEREQIRVTGELPAADLDPSKRSIAAHVQARGLTLESCVEILADMLGIPSVNILNEYDILSWARAHVGPPPTIVIDGLDEAGPAAARIVDGLLKDLATTTRLIIATREVPGSGTDPSLLQRLGPPAQQIELAPGERDPDLHPYVIRRVTDRDGAPIAPIMDPQQVADAISTLVVRSAEHAGDGGFLLARVLTSQLIAHPLSTTAGWESQLAPSIEQAFEQDLAAVRPRCRDGAELPDAARNLLTALAYSYGPGFPADDIWPAVAGAVSGTVVYDRLDAFWALDEHGRYVTASSLDGEAVYRIHHRLAESLRTQAEDYPRERIAMVILDMYEAHLDAGRPAAAHPYLWHFAWRHAVDGGPGTIERFTQLADRDTALRPDLARALVYLSVVLGNAGRPVDAVGPAETAVELYQQLAAEVPALHAELAGALGNLGDRLRGVGRLRDAVGFTERAVAIHEQLSIEDGTSAEAAAKVLTALAARYRDLGRFQDAVEPGERAVAIYEALVETNPGHRGDLAHALAILSTAYSRTGRHEESLALAKRALAIREALDDGTPRHRGDLALILDNLAGRHDDTGHSLDAIAAAERASEILQDLSQQNPAYADNLASVSHNLASYYHAAGRHDDAVAAAEDAVATLERLSDTNPGRRSHVASALNNLGNYYDAVGRNRDAIKALERAAELYDGLIEEGAASPDSLARALTNLGARYSHAGRYDEALEAEDRAVRLYDQLVTEDPAYRDELASALNNQAHCAKNVGRAKDAIALAERAADIRRSLPADTPLARRELASVLVTLGSCYGSTGTADPIAPVEEAIAILEPLAAEHPNFRGEHASALSNLALFYVDAGRGEEALKAAQCARTIYEDLAHKSRADRRNLAAALDAVAIAFTEIGQAQEAVEPAESAVAILKELGTESAGDRHDLATALANLSATYHHAGRDRDAVEPAERAVTLLEALAADYSLEVDDLATALDTLSACYARVGQPDTGPARWDAVLANPAIAPAAKGSLLALRHHTPDQRDMEIDSLVKALALAANDGRRTATLHTRLRHVRAEDPARFDARWPGELPEWLLLSNEVLAAFGEWAMVTTTDLAEGRELLRASTEVLLGNQARPALEELELLLGEPGVVAQYLPILERCRAHGIDAAYAQMILVRAVEEWLNVEDLVASERFLEEHATELLTDAALSLVAQLDAFHTAILVLACNGRADEAFRLLRSPETLPSTLARLRREGSPFELSAIGMLAAVRNGTDAERAEGVVHYAIALALIDEGDRAIEELSRMMPAGHDPTDAINVISDAIIHRAEHATELARLIQALTPPASASEDAADRPT